MKSVDIRKKFFDYFVALQHEKVPSSSLIPAQDPTLLFTNAGMNQFKDLFLGKEQRSYTRAVSIQKCVRAGGKHNDLDNVGFTKRHLTFFEMMGNFSFGDYFKKEAIPFAWNFLTQHMQLDPQDLCVSVHYSDDEAYAIWRDDIGLPEEKIYRCGADNFWQMGDIGPCGPCTEIFFDRQARDSKADTTATPETDGERFLEIWNVVFMQFNRQEDGTDVPLKQTGVDTGMGLERLTLVMQGKDTVYETDLFAPIIKKIEDLTGIVYEQADQQIKAACNVVADHVRSVCSLLADGCAPSNEGRGYVLRKIIRRAALFAKKLSDTDVFLPAAEVFIGFMRDMYPELGTAKDRILAVISAESQRFSANLERGQSIIEEYFEQSLKTKKISGKQAFTLYDTYGFPFEVTQLLCKERGFTVDRNEFEAHMEKQRQASGKKMKQTASALVIPEAWNTEFTGYTSYVETAEIIGLVHEDKVVTHVAAGEQVWLVTQKTPFYVECGGQVNDRGHIVVGDASFELLDLKKIDSAILMCVQPTVDLTVGQTVVMQVDKKARLATMKNHTATHLLQAALQEVFGKQVRQAGSLVQPELLRFDFTYHKSLSAEEIKDIENVVNQKIWENIPVTIEHTTYKQAVDSGVIAFFGDKYNPDNVRAVQIPGFSAELCGGTHVAATGEIGSFKIVEETALAAGQRRIVAYTGPQALQAFQQAFSLQVDASRQLKVQANDVIKTIQDLQKHNKDLGKQLASMRLAHFEQQIPELLNTVEHVGDTPFGFFVFKDVGIDLLRPLAQKIIQKESGVYVLVSKSEQSIQFVVVTDKKQPRVDMQQVRAALVDVGLQGGGNTHVLQGGGSGEVLLEDIKQVVHNAIQKHIV